MRRLGQENAGGIGERGRHAGKALAHMREGSDLPGIDGVVRLLGGDEMAHHEAWREGTEQLSVFGELDRRFHPQAEAVHAGVDMEGRRQAACAGAAEGRPLLDLFQRAEHRPQVVRPVGGSGAGQKAVQHVDHGIGRGRAHAPSLDGVGDEEGAAAGAIERRHSLLDANAIGVGLDDRRRLGGADPCGQGAPVGDQGGQVDGEKPARLILADGGAGPVRCAGHNVRSLMSWIFRLAGA